MATVRLDIADFINDGYEFPATGGILEIYCEENSSEIYSIAIGLFNDRKNVISVVTVEDGERAAEVFYDDTGDYPLWMVSGLSPYDYFTISITVPANETTDTFTGEAVIFNTNNELIVAPSISQKGAAPSPYKWIPVTEDFDRSLPIKKWRYNINNTFRNKYGNYDCVLSELPNIYVENGGVWNNPQPSNGYAFSNRFNVGQNYFSSRYYGFTDGMWTATTSSHTTLVEGTTYEFECPVDLYWGGNHTSPFDAELASVIQFYVPWHTFECDTEEITATYESGSSIVTVTADSYITWTAITSNDWITITNPTGAGNGSFTINYTENGPISRKGNVTLTSSEGDIITIAITQTKQSFIYYARKIYRSGSLVKKMYRSGELIYLRLNPSTEQPEPELPTPSEPTYEWVEITADFDRSIPFTKVRWDFSKSWYDGYFSELPNINCDNKGWTSIRDAEWGYAGQYTMNLSAKKCYIRNQSTDSYDLYDMYAITTQVDTNLYEYEYSVPLYWGGVSSSSLYDNGLGIYVYVEVNPTNK